MLFQIFLKEKNLLIYVPIYANYVSKIHLLKSAKWHKTATMKDYRKKEKVKYE